MRDAASIDWSTFAQGIEWWQVIAAVIVIILGWILGRYAGRGATALVKRVPGEFDAYAGPVGRGVKYLIIGLAIGIALVFLGANIQPLLAVMIIVAVIVVLVLRGTADNFASSVLIQSRHPVRVGDEIQVDTPGGAMIGTITETNARSVILVTADGRTVHVPNAKLLADSVVNHTSHGARRSEVSVRLARAADESVDHLLARVVAATEAVAGVHTHEGARTLTTAITPERVSAVVQFWHHPANGITITSDVVRALSAAFADQGVEAAVTSVASQAPLIPQDKF